MAIVIFKAGHRVNGGDGLDGLMQCLHAKLAALTTIKKWPKVKVAREACKDFMWREVTCAA